jgi:hypothetical protein
VKCQMTPDLAMRPTILRNGHEQPMTGCRNVNASFIGSDQHNLNLHAWDTVMLNHDLLCFGVICMDRISTDFVNEI